MFFLLPTRLSVCLSHPAAAAGLLLRTRWAGHIDGLLHGRRADDQQQQQLSAAGECGQCHVVS